MRRHTFLKTSLVAALLLGACVGAVPASPTLGPASATSTTLAVATAPPTAAASATAPTAAASATVVGSATPALGPPPPAFVVPPAGTDGYPWWNDTVFYEIFVRSFYDGGSRGGPGGPDGIGDLPGLISKLDYLQALGVTGLWLMPIQPAPSYHGYDPTDYYAINPDYGTLGDFQRLMAEAHRRGMRVILDFVINHTSDQHPWFVASQNPQSPFRDWYIWSKTDPGYVGPWGEQVWHQATNGDYYYGIFTGSQPDLNYRNAAVTAKMDDVARFWLQDQGADGFRLDGAKHLIEDGQVQQNSDSTHTWFQAFRKFYKQIKPTALTVGEISGDPASVVASYAEGDQLDLGFDFPLAETFLNSARTARAGDIASALSADYAAFKPLQFATFLTNHDQNRALSQLAGKVGKGKVAAALLLTAPGVPFIYYGEEIGMLGLKPDEQLRTPMQWSAAPNAGFTTGTPWEAVNPDFAMGRNVADELSDPSSLLTTYRALIQARNQHAALRVGAMYLPQVDQTPVFANLRVSKAEAVLVVINLGKDPVTDYHLSLASGPLSGMYRASVIMGGGPAADLAANSQGGFDRYQPVLTLPAYSILFLQLQKSGSNS